MNSGFAGFPNAQIEKIYAGTDSSMLSTLYAFDDRYENYNVLTENITGGSVTATAYAQNLNTSGQQNLGLLLAINKAKESIALNDYVADDDSIGLSTTTVSRMQEFLFSLQDSARMLNKDIKIPRIRACVDGSLDLYWAGNGNKVLVNIPSSQKEDIGFFGLDTKNNKQMVEGSIPAESDQKYNSLLIAWLMAL